jgi:hypothetical protein
MTEHWTASINVTSANCCIWLALKLICSIRAAQAACCQTLLSLLCLSVILAQTDAAQAEDIGLSFELASPAPVQINPIPESATAAPPITPLVIPAQASSAPSNSGTATLPPPPSLAAAVEPPHLTVTIARSEPARVEVQFHLPPIAAPVPHPQPVVVQPDPTAGGRSPASDFPIEETASHPDLFAGGSDSLVAKAVGSAEGTRTPEGHRTPAYAGHVDPGNGVWNLGSFSYQHGASSPEAADAKQLRRLQTQAATLQAQANAKGIALTLAATLNGIDLANQSPRAALSRGGYIDRLDQAYDMGLQGAEAVLWARTRAFLDPDTDRWNAPGLGNTVHSITADQARRQQAIDRAIAAHPHSALAEAERVENQPPPDQD